MKKIILLSIATLLYLNIYSAGSEPVGAVQGVFNVSPIGGAGYSIPIHIPQGIGAMQPSVAIVYDSQAGNGMIGWGCNLSGFSVITRGPKTIYYDGKAKGMKYDVNDAFYLDGQSSFIQKGVLLGPMEPSISSSLTL